MQDAFERGPPLAISLHERGESYEEADARRAFDEIAKRYLTLHAPPHSKRTWYDDPGQVLGEIFDDERRAVRKLILAAHRMKKLHNINF